jgi:predicted secreted hydrolase
MGDNSDQKKDSYYYSFPYLVIKGVMTLPDPDEPGVMKEVKVSGEAWFDKQWGNFKPVTWYWSSVRFNDGDRAMLFYFPEQEHKEGTYIPEDKEAYPFVDFTVESFEEKDSYLKWTVYFSNRQAEYTIVPYLDIPFQSTRLGITYWEGMCRLLDENGQEAGWCVLEHAQ